MPYRRIIVTTSGADTYTAPLPHRLGAARPGGQSRASRAWNSLAEMEIPDGETVVEVPAALLREVNQPV